MCTSGAGAKWLANCLWNPIADSVGRPFDCSTIFVSGETSSFNEGPVGREPEECETTEYNYYHWCSVDVSPHDIPRGSITHFLTAAVDKTVLNDTMTVGQDVLDKHYDTRDEKARAESGWVSGERPSIGDSDTHAVEASTTPLTIDELALNTT